MAASVLNSEVAVQASVQIVRTFVKLRRLVLTNAAFETKLDALEKKYDSQFSVVFEAIRKLMTEPRNKARQIGFRRSGK